MAEPNPNLINPSFIFPDESDSPSVKRSKEWGLKYLNAAFYTYKGLNGALGWGSYDNYQRLKMYVLGKQPTEKYKELTALDQKSAGNVLVTDWSVWKVLTKLRRNALTLLEKINYDISIDPIDPLAKSEIQDELATMKAKILLSQSLGKSGMPIPPTVQPQQDEPQNINELNVKAMGIRHSTAMDAELIVDYILNTNDYPALRRMLNEDRFDYGFAVTKDESDGESVCVRRCDPEQMVISPCNYPDFRDMRYIGEVVMMTPAQVIAESNGQVTDDQIRNIWKLGNLNGYGAENYEVPFGVGNNFNNWTTFLGSGTVKVLDLEFYTIDEIEREESENKFGNIYYETADNEKKEKRKKRGEDNKYNYKKKKVQYIYTGKWIVGTNILYNYGPASFQKRDPENYSNAKSSYHVTACEFYKMQTVSRVESVIPYVDDLELVKAKRNHLMMTLIPDGIDIDFEALENIDLAAGGGEDARMSPMQLVNLYLTRGISVGRRRSPLNGGQYGPTMQAITGSEGKQLALYAAAIQENLAFIREAFGLNNVTDGSNPQSRTDVTSVNMAIQGTNNALGDLFWGDAQMTAMLTESCLIRAQDICKRGNGKVFAGALGSDLVSRLRADPPIDKYRYGISTSPKPTDEENAQLLVDINDAIKLNQIGIDDKMMIQSIRNYKEKCVYLTFKIQQNKNQAQQAEMQKNQALGQTQIQSAQAAEQSKQQTLQMEFQLKGQFEQMKNGLEMQLKQLEIQGVLEGKKIDAAGRVDAASIQAGQRDAADVRGNNTKMIDIAHSAKNDAAQLLASTNIEPGEEGQSPQDQPEQPATPKTNFSFLSQPQPAQ